MNTTATARLEVNSFGYHDYQKSAANWRRVSRREPCPVCHKPDFCEVSGDGQSAHCMRVPSERPLAYRQGGWLHSLYPAGSATAADLRPLPAAPATPGENSATKIPLASIATRHRAISFLLDRLDLSPEHQRYLESEGFSRELALKLGYRTLPRNGRKELARQVAELAGIDEARRLAFLYEKKGKNGSRYFQFSAARPEMLLIPIRDSEGRLAGLKGRWAAETTTGGKTGREYRLLSAGSIGGASLGTPLHIARPETITADETGKPGQQVIITEGEKKADYIARRTGLICVGVQGTGNWRATRGSGHLAMALAGLKTRAVEVAFDADLEQNPRVARDLHNMCCQLQAAGYEVKVRRWPLAAAKGYDDLLRLGLESLSRLEPFSPASEGKGQPARNKKFIRLDAETLEAGRFRAAGENLRPLLSVEEARLQHARLFQKAFSEHFFSLGRTRQSLVVTSNPGTGKTHAALAGALQAIQDYPQGRILYLADNKEIYRQWIRPGELLHSAWEAGLVAVREGRQKAAGPFECRRINECEAAGKQRHAPAWDICGACPFFSAQNWQKYLQERGLAPNTPREWDCRRSGYWSGFEAAAQARLVLAPKAAFLNNSCELAGFDIIILDESPVEHLLEKVDVTRETLGTWREALHRQAALDEDNEYFFQNWQRDYLPYIRLFEVLERAIISGPTRQEASTNSRRQRLWPFLPELLEAAAATRENLGELLEACLASPAGPTGRYTWERPFPGPDGSLNFPLHFARELAESLCQEVTTKPVDTRLWLNLEGNRTGLAVFKPRAHLLEVLRGESGREYKNSFGQPPTVVVLDATPAPVLLDYILNQDTRVINYEVAQHIEVTQLTNSLYTREELLARDNQALDEVSRLLEQESRRYRSAAIFCHKAFNPAIKGQGPRFKVEAPGVELHWGHFDRDNKALNSLSGVEFIAVAGHYCHPLDQLRAQVQAFRYSPVAANLNEQPENGWKLRSYGWQDEAGQGIARRCRSDLDSEVQAAIEHNERAAILQAIGRGRPTLRSAGQPLKVLVVTAVPLGHCLPVKRLAEAKELLGETVLSQAQVKALAQGRMLRRQQQQNRRSEAVLRIEQALSDLPQIAAGKPYLEWKELARLARVNAWQIKLLGLTRFIRTEEENKAAIGPELFITIYKQDRGYGPFISAGTAPDYALPPGLPVAPSGPSPEKPAGLG